MTDVTARMSGSVTATARRSGRACIIVDELLAAAPDDPAGRWTAAVFIPAWTARSIAATLRALLTIATVTQHVVDGHPVWCGSRPHLLPDDRIHELHIGGDIEVGDQAVSFSLCQYDDRLGGRPFVHFVAHNKFTEAGVYLTLEDAAALAAQLTAIRAPRRLAVAA